MNCDSGQIQNWFEQANALVEKKRWAEAAALHRKVIEDVPHHEWSLNNLGYCLVQDGQQDEAIYVLRRAITVAPRNAMAHANLVMAMEAANQRHEAIPVRRRLVELKPDIVEYAFALGNSLLSAGRVPEALHYYRRAIRLAPNHKAAICNYLLALNYSDRESPEAVAMEHFRLAQKWAKPRRPAAEFSQCRDPERKLRIGYISADLANHPVGKLMAPLISAHNSAEFDVYAYSDRRDGDRWTEEIRDNCAGFVQSVDFRDEDLERRILQDQIDILVELTGYTGGRNRLGVLASGAAPIQMSFMGYPNTTGSVAVDYRITDAYCDPPGQTERLHSEELIRLQQGFLCYAPAINMPATTAAPFRQRGHVTVGSFNNPIKISATALAAWAQILQQTPGCRLIVKYGESVRSEALRERWRESFAAAGVDCDRIRFLTAVPSLAEHLQIIASVDLALDPFPYQGTMTTLETLSMGVPVITRLGETYCRRASSALLMRIGLDELVTNSNEQYIARAVSLAREPHRLEVLRDGLRDRFLGSEVCGVAAFVAELESVYRDLWRQWCAKHVGTIARSAATDGSPTARRQNAAGAADRALRRRTPCV